MAEENHELVAYIIDDDESIRHALSRLLRSADMRVVACDSVDEFLAIPDPGCHACVIADLRMPGTSALALTNILAYRGLHLPVIIVTAQNIESARAAAKQAGVWAFFRKPVDGQALLDAIDWALEEKAADLRLQPCIQA